MAWNKNDTYEIKAKRKRSILRKFFRVVCSISVSLLSLAFICLLIIHIPPVQKQVGQWAIKALGNAINKRVTCEYIRVSLMGSIEVRNLTVHHDERFGKEELGSIRKLYVVLDPLSLGSKRITIRELFADTPKLRVVVLPDRNHNLQIDPYKRGQKRLKRDRDDDSAIREFFSCFRLDHIAVKNAEFVLDYQPNGYHLTVPSMELEGHQLPDSDQIKIRTQGFCVKNSHPERLDSTADFRVEADIWGGGVSNSRLTVCSSSGKALFSSRCDLLNFRHPLLKLEGTLLCDLNEIKNLTRLNPDLEGSAYLQFSGNGLADDLVLKGVYRAIDLQFGQFKFSGISGPVNYNDFLVTLPVATGHAYKGTIEGSGQICVQKEHKSLQIDAHIDNADLSGLTRDLRIPFDLATDLDMNISIHSNGFHAEDIILTGTATGTEKFSAGANFRKSDKWSPFRLSADFAFKESVFEISNASLTNKDHFINLENNRFAKSVLSGKIDGNTIAPADLARRIERAVPLDYEVPDMAGETRFSIDMAGTPKDYRVAGFASSDDIKFKEESLGATTLAMTVNPEILDVNHFSITGSKLQSTGHLQWSIPPPQSGKGISLENGSITVDQLDLTLPAKILNLNLSGNAQAVIQITHPGPGNHTLSVMQMDNLKIGAVPVNRAVLRGQVTPDGVFDGILSAKTDDAAVEARFDYPRTGIPTIHLEGNNIPFQFIPGLDRFQAGGVFDIEAESRAAGNHWVIPFQLNGHDISTGTHVSDQMVVRGTVEMSVNPVVQWNAVVNQDAAASTGFCKLTAPYECNMNASLHTFPLAVFSEIANRNSATPHPFSGMVTLKTEISGSLADRSTLSGLIEIQDLQVNYMGIDLQLESPSSLELSTSSLKLPPLLFSHPFAELNLSGEVQSGGTMVLDAHGQIDLQAVEKITAFFENTRGNCDFDLRLDGSWFDPNFSGKCLIQEFFSHLPLFNSGLEDYHAEIRFKEKIGRITYMDGLAGGAYFGGSGEFGMARYGPELFDIRLNGSDVEFEYPKGFLSSGDVELEITGNLPDINIAGKVDLQQSVYRSRINYKTMIVNESRAKLAFLEKRKTVRNSVSSPLHFNPQFNISVAADDNVVIDNNIARVELNMDIDVLGNLKKPRILGHVDALHGDITFLQRTYELMNASIDFADPAKVDPVLVLQAGATIDDYQVILDVSGRIYSDLTIRPSSTPPLNDLDLWNLLLIGKTREEMSSGEDYLAGGVAYVTGSIQEQIERRFEYWMGFDEFSIDPIMSTSDESPSARFTVKKRLGPDLSVTYSRSASSASDLLLFEYQLSDNLFIITHKKEDNSIGADLIYRWEFGE
ncbi:translocation/assembly module TamB domain-containing protein [bacterium]|nr:translocation/assembly module TamB domain-containing protein [candidate division CSSED10-310 bacterium]